MKLFLAFGANLGDRRAAIDEAIARLEPALGRPVRRSSFYETQPVGFASDHLFLNAAAWFDTALGAGEILALTQRVERELGRTAKSSAGRYADRSIDIDLISLGDLRLSTPALTLPHPRLAGRRFVLEPLAEIAPDETLPGFGCPVSALLAALDRPRLVRLERATAADAAAVGRLLAALSPGAAPLSPDALAALVATPQTRLYLALDETDVPSGMATLCLAASPTGVKAWVEDVAVLPACRGRGYARALLAHLEAEARHLGAKSLNLTSRPGRVAANRLYRSAGFEPRETNVYRKPLGGLTGPGAPESCPADGK